ncbi:hypothetical protein PV08_03786 [Exophiala spinifera]|uniref:Uncharacterized protein n=1 Tax=Exophiala spinifera TaxID=91928 RepID=A0A0D2BCA4_9EURO|nr:uncharacterized protein PV08_03786 [Exophiala spinifera]KIW16598.1 hypothetical protein PV08_03786 [Exophiala spinifera]
MHACDALEDAPSELEPAERGDLKVQHLGRTDLELLHHHELKWKEATRSDLQQVEHQAYSDRVSYLAAHEDVPFVYAVTSFGTRARMWTCEPDATYLEPGFGSGELAEPSQYIEAHSSEATELRKGYDRMKRDFHQLHVGVLRLGRDLQNHLAAISSRGTHLERREDGEVGVYYHGPPSAGMVVAPSPKIRIFLTRISSKDTATRHSPVRSLPLNFRRFSRPSYRLLTIETYEVPRKHNLFR